MCGSCPNGESRLAGTGTGDKPIKVIKVPECRFELREGGYGSFSKFSYQKTDNRTGKLVTVVVNGKSGKLSHFKDKNLEYWYFGGAWSGTYDGKPVATNLGLDCRYEVTYKRMHVMLAQTSNQSEQDWFLSTSGPNVCGTPTPSPSR